MISNLKVAVVGSILVLPWSIALSSGAHADTFPSKVVRIVVPFAAGGTADITAPQAGRSPQQEMGATRHYRKQGRVRAAWSEALRSHERLLMGTRYCNPQTLFCRSVI